MRNPFVILTGASGVGKTAIAEAIERVEPGIAVYLGDKIGPPPAEVLASYGPTHGPGGPSQRGFALYWIGQIAQQSNPPPVLLEMQCRIAFLDEALALHKVTDARIILVECGDDIRDRRLIHERRQPELANEDMANWSRYLHREAEQAGYEILDTGAVSLSQATEHIRSYLISLPPQAGSCR